MIGKDISLVIPLFNEESNVENIYAKIKKSFGTKLSYQLVLVNNGSWDKTKKIIENLSKKDRNVLLIDVKKNIGYGFGILSGLNSATGDIIGWIDGDDTTDPNDVYLLYKKMKETSSDVGFSERIVRGQNLFRKLESFFYNTLLFVLYGRNFRDINSKPKLIKREAYRKFNLQSKDWFVDTEFCISAYNRKLSHTRILRREVERRHGKSAVKLTTALEFFKNIMWYRVLNHI